MFTNQFKFCSPCVAAALAVLMGAAALAQEPTPGIPVLVGEEKGAAASIAGGYWIGVQCEPVEGALKSHLKLEHGLVVYHASPDSPASKAGLREHDILLQFGDKKLTNVPDLMQAIQNCQDKEAKLVVLRDGQETTLNVTPAKRPADVLQALPVPGPGDHANMERAFRGMWQGGKGPMRMLFMHPGVVAEAKEFPANLSISIVKEGDKPAKVTVKQGDKTYETTEDKLDALPEEVRPFAKRMLGRDLEFGLQVEGQPFNLPVPGPGAAPLEFPSLNPGERFGKHFEEMERMIEKLRKEFEADRPALKDMQKQLEELRNQFQERRTERKEKAKEAEKEPAGEKT